VKYSDIFEKSEFVQRLVQAREKNTNNGNISDASDAAQKSTVDHTPRASQASPDQVLRTEVEAMPLAAIRSELAKFGVSTQGAFEKRVIVAAAYFRVHATLLKDVTLEIGIRRSAVQSPSGAQSRTRTITGRQPLL
jgi:hypothetical protein